MTSVKLDLNKHGWNDYRKTGSRRKSFFRSSGLSKLNVAGVSMEVLSEATATTSNQADSISPGQWPEPRL